MPFHPRANRSTSIVPTPSVATTRATSVFAMQRISGACLPLPPDHAKLAFASPSPPDHAELASPPLSSLPCSGPAHPALSCAALPVDTNTPAAWRGQQSAVNPCGKEASQLNSMLVVMHFKCSMPAFRIRHPPPPLAPPPSAPTVVPIHGSGTQAEAAVHSHRTQPPNGHAPLIEQSNPRLTAAGAHTR